MRFRAITDFLYGVLRELRSGTETSSLLLYLTLELHMPQVTILNS